MLRIITGPPAAGKSTHIRTHRAPGDITIDFDELASTIAGLEPANHEHEQHIITITRATRKALIDAAIKHADEHDVWIIHSTPSPAAMDRYRELGAEITTIDPGKDTVMKRIKEQRPATMLKIAGRWYDQQHDEQRQRGRTSMTNTKVKRTTKQRGYDNRHKRIRKRLIATMTPGTPCWWCGKPMYPEAEKNPDGRPLAADHVQAGGAGRNEAAGRLLHFTCNSARQDGARDDTRPAITHAEAVAKAKPTFRWR